ncbi:cadherin repeat domain-containing protein, partial [Dolichospermum circinale]|uniref:cadherin repeat domain-containing protein n=1 Tax=Dolichospermum circinale TaxID=109265 RepID=UPI0018C8ED90
FTITNNQLKTNSVFNFEAKNSYRIRIKTTDQGGLSFEKQLTIGVSNVNETPTNLTLSTSTVAENKTVGTVIGNLSTTDPDTANTFTYSLVSGGGATDNSLFTITNNQLKTNAVFDFETKNSYSIRVRTTDQGGLFFEKQLTIGVSNVNETPTNLTLSNSAVAENKVLGTVIGNLTTTDPDTANTFTYRLVTGTGATDNSLFTITNNQLKTNSVFDFETKNSYSIRVQTRDQGGLTYQKQLTINISNLTDNTITGTANTNNITTTNDKDIIDAVAGNDTITSVFTNLQQNDNINGGLGTDTLIITGGTSANSLTINANNTTNQIGNIPGTTVLGFERFDLSSFTGNVNFTGTDGNDWIKGGSGIDNLSGGKGNDSLYLGNDTAVDNVNYVLGHGTDTVYQFVRGAGGDRLNFTGIANFDVITSGTSTLVRVGDGISGNARFGTGQLLVTLYGTSGFNSTNANVNLFGGTFLFS